VKNTFSEYISQLHLKSTTRRVFGLLQPRQRTRHVTLHYVALQNNSANNITLQSTLPMKCASNITLHYVPLQGANNITLHQSQLNIKS